jgi:hypothetical protein
VDVEKFDTSGRINGAGAEMIGYPTIHHYGRVPIQRCFDRRRPRYTHVGLPRYEVLAEIQREYYNRDSELILSDTTQAHPLLQGPEDYIAPNGTVTIGPGWVLPKKKNTTGTAVTYEGFDVVQFPKQGAESLRTNKEDLRDDADAAALLVKPAGTRGTSKGTVEQSGVSKRMDTSEGNDLLAEIAEALQRVETQVAALVYQVMTGKVATKDQIKITYPRQFNLLSHDEFLKAVQDWQAARDGAGATPQVDAELLKASMRLLLQGRSDEEYRRWDEEIDDYVDGESKAREEAREGLPEEGEPVSIPMPTGESKPGEEPPPEHSPMEMTQPIKEAVRETA